MKSVIPNPLWELMLSTNDCYPGCSCDEDRFDRSASRINAWVTKNPEKIQIVIDQLEGLINNDHLVVDELSMQCNYYLATREDARIWLEEWLRQVTLPS
jgi:hypothetical protein